MQKYDEVIDNIKSQFDALKKSIQSKNTKPGSKFFNTDNRLSIINEIEENLALGKAMSIKELENALTYIENLGFRDENKTIRQFKSFLEDTQCIVLGKNTKKQSNILIDTSGNGRYLANLLTEVHQSLLSYYQNASIHANGQKPASTSCYDELMLAQSQPFKDLTITSQQPQQKDNSTIVRDIVRESVTIYNAVIHAKDKDDKEDRGVINSLENFAGSDIYTQGSKANRIYHFGGQYLSAVLCHEFINSNSEGLTFNKIRHKTNWSKTEEGEIYAVVNLDFITCMHPQTGEFYAIGSNGSSLMEISMDELAKIKALCDQKNKGEDEIVPICSMTAKFTLPYNEETKEHFIQVSDCTMKFMTPDLHNSKDPEYEMESQPGPS